MEEAIKLYVHIASDFKQLLHARNQDNLQSRVITGLYSHISAQNILSKALLARCFGHLKALVFFTLIRFLDKDSHIQTTFVFKNSFANDIFQNTNTIQSFNEPSAKHEGGSIKLLIQKLFQLYGTTCFIFEMEIKEIFCVIFSRNSYRGVLDFTLDDQLTFVELSFFISRSFVRLL